MKNQNMRDLQKRWAEDRKKAEKKLAKATPKKPQPAATATDSAKTPAK